MNYWGSSEVLKFACRAFSPAIEKAGEWDQVVRLADSMVSPVLESELNGVFLSFPAKTSTNINALGVLWVLAMTEYLSRIYASTSRNVQTGYKDSNIEQYDKVMEQVRVGTMTIPGATRRSTTLPSVSIFKTQVFLPDQNQPQQYYSEQNQYGLRR